MAIGAPLANSALYALKSSHTSLPRQPCLSSSSSKPRKRRAWCPERLSAKSNTTAAIGSYTVVQ